MPFTIERNDITRIECDAIVNAAKNSLAGGGGVDGAIHRKAGFGLFLECRKIGFCETGKAVITNGYKLPARYIIHTVGPKWHGGKEGERELLYSCYKNSLDLARENGLYSVAFPLISSGAYGYPEAEALKVAVEAIRDFLALYDMDVRLIIYGKASFMKKNELSESINEYIDENYERERSTAYSCSVDSAAEELSDIVNDLDESFSEMLMRKIDERGMTDSECYKKANIDRKLFSKIRSDKFYRPKKTTALAFCIALELSLDETQDMLMKAGFALSHSNKSDLIIEYFIKKGIYDIFTVNEALFTYDQMLLG